MFRAHTRYGVVFSLLAAGLLLSGCLSDGGKTAAVAQAGEGPAVNTSDSGTGAPTIAGSPSSQAVSGSNYSFTPTVDSAGDDSLSFRAENLPGWTDFDESTGRISGMPDFSDVGEYSGIRITATDSTGSVTLGPFSIRVVATATGSASLSWQPPTQNTDGSALTDLAGYRIYWGTAEDELTNSVTVNQPGITAYVVDELAPGTWFFAARAFNSDGMESQLSEVASKSVL